MMNMRGFYKPRLEEDRKKNTRPTDKDYLSLYKENSVGKNINQPQRTDLHVQEPGLKDIYIDEFGMESAKYIDFSFDRH